MENEEKSFLGVEHLSLRALVLAALGSGIITASSMYVALKLGMVPWPTVFAAIISMGILRALRKTTKNEVNVAQTGITAGAMIAAGIGFTLPGLWKTGAEITIASYFGIFFSVSMVGLLMGLLLTWFWRKMLLEKENLPFPIGIATAETIESSSKGSIKTVLLLASLAISAIYTIIRDWFLKIPSYIAFKFTAKYNMDTGLLMSPLAPAIGYMIGPLYTLVLFIGAIIGYIILVPLGLHFGWFSSIEDANSIRQAIGLGLMVGAGIGVILKFLVDIIKKWNKNRKKEKEETKFQFNIKNIRISLIVCTISFIFCIVAGLSPVVSGFVLLGVFLTTLMSAMITGQTGIDPLEIFGILVMIAIRFIVPELTIETSLLIAATIAITSGFVGDTMFDYKTGQIFKTNPKAQLISQAVRRNCGSSCCKSYNICNDRKVWSSIFRITSCTTGKFCFWDDKWKF